MDVNQRLHKPYLASKKGSDRSPPFRVSRAMTNWESQAAQFPGNTNQISAVILFFAKSLNKTGFYYLTARHVFLCNIR